MRNKLLTFIIIFCLSSVIPAFGDELRESLIKAVENGEITRVREILDQANKEIGLDKLPSLDALLRSAVERNKPEVIEYLIKKGAKTSDFSLLITAAAKNYPDSAKVLIKYGAGVNKPDNFQLEAPLQMAAKHGSIETATVLLDNGAYVNLVLQNNLMWSPLLYAVRYNQLKMAELLLSRGAAVNLASINNGTPVHMAVELKNPEMLALLLSKKANPNSYDTDLKATPLHTAVLYNSPECVRLLLNNGADTAALDHWKQTPLHRAARNGSVEIAGLLLDKGADIKAVSEYGDTPLHYAAEEGHAEMIKFLLSKGADKKAKGYSGRTPLEAAKSNKKKDVYALLK